MPGTEVVVDGGQLGPGVVYLWQRSVFGTMLFVETVTPLTPLTQRVCHSVFASPSLPSIVGMGFLWAAIVQFERDVPVWYVDSLTAHVSLRKIVVLLDFHRMPGACVAGRTRSS